jgi:hypothetical protein
MDIMDILSVIKERSMGVDLTKQFEVLEYGDYGCIFKEEVIGELGKSIIFRHSQTHYIVESTVNYEPLYEERHFTNRKNARNFAYKATCVHGYILKQTYK